jgi:hypothetical protein
MDRTRNVSWKTKVGKLKVTGIIVGRCDSRPLSSHPFSSHPRFRVTGVRVGRRVTGWVGIRDQGRGSGEGTVAR